MARKRLNMKFLILGLGPVLLLGGGLAAWKVVPRFFPKARWLVHGTPDEHAAKAKGFYEQGKFQESADAYKYALFLQGKGDAQLYTALADSYAHLILKDDENHDQALQFYQAALGSDPTYMPALQKLLEWWEEDPGLWSGRRAVQGWDQLIMVAQKVLAVDPNNRRAKIAMHKATISKWRLAEEIPQQQIDDSVNALLELAQPAPFDAEAVFCVMQAWMKRVEGRLIQGDRDGARKIVADVMKLVTDSLAQHPDDPVLHLRCAMAYRGMGLAERAPGQPPKYMEEATRELRLAGEMVKADHPMFAEIKLFHGKQLESQIETMPEAEKVYRGVLAERPTEISIRVALATLLARNPTTQLDAITLLEQAPPADLTRFFGVKAVIAKRYELAALFDLISTRLDILPRLRGQPGHDEMLQQIEASFAKMAAMPRLADSPMGLQTRGRIEMAKGQSFQAVQTLERAMNLLPPSAGSAPEESRYRLMFYLASAYIFTSQNGEAKNLLSTIVQDVPQLTNARLMLAQLLLQENRNDEAKVHLDWLAKAMPKDSRVVRMSMRTLDKEKDKDKLWDLYQQLPQTTAEEMTEKAQVAIYIERRDEAVKLLESLRTSRPTDANVRVTLSRVYSDMGDKPRALEMADEALKIVPDHPQLKLLRAEVAGADVSGVRREIVDRLADPFRKALLQYELAVQEERTQDAAGYLQIAVALNPEDGRVIELIFNRALIQRDWPRALESVEKLAKQDRDGVGGLLYRVRYSLAKGELSQAADLANQLVQKMKEFAPSYVVLGQVQKAQKKYADAMQSFETALAKVPRELTALRELIEISYITNSPARAKEYIAQARRVFPDRVAFKEQELAHELKYGDPEKVIAPRQEMLKLAIDRKDPAELRQWISLGNAYVAVARTKDTPAAARPFLDKGRETFAQAMAKFPDDMALVDLYVDVQLQLRNPADAERAILALRDRETWKNKPGPTILLATYFNRAGKPAEQEKILRDYLATTPANIPIQLELSAILFKQQKLDDALNILEINADEPEIRRQRIEIQIGGGRLADAEREIKTAMDSTPSPSTMLLNRQAFVYMKSGRATEALQVLTRALSQSPNDMEALFLQGSLYLSAQRNLPQVVSNLQAARDNRFKELDARVLLAEAFHYSKDDEAATRELEEAVRLFPEEKRPRLRLLDYYANAAPPNWVQAERMLREARNHPKLATDTEVINTEARMWLLRKQPARATQILADALRTAPEDLNLFRTYCQSLLDGKENQKLIGSTEAMVQAKKAPWWVYQYRGKARRAMDDRQTALLEFQAGMDVAWAANDDNASSLILSSIAEDIGVAAARARISSRANEKGGYRWQLMMSYLGMLENDFDTAITWAEKVANDSDVTPDYMNSARRQLGMLYLRATPPQVGKAVSVYRQLIQGSPKDVVSLNNLASAMILPNSGYSPREALEYSERAYKIIAETGQVNAYIYDTQGYVLILAGRVPEGITILQQALDQEPIPDACYHLGEAYLQLSNPRITEAQDVLKQGLAIQEAAARDNKPVDPDLKSKLEKTLEKADQMAAKAKA